MVVPDYREFVRLSRRATLVPVARAVSADLLTPVSAFLAVAFGEKHSFLLESVEGGERIGRYTFLGARPYLVLEGRGEQSLITRGRRRERRAGNILETAKELLQQHKVARVPGLPPFTAGAVGFVAYDFVRRLERLPEKATDDLHVPDGVLMFFDRLLAFDHVRHQIHILAAADVGDKSAAALRRAYERAVEDIAAIERRLARGVRPADLRGLQAAGRLRRMQVRSSATRRQYMEGVRSIKRHIARGDVYQTVLSLRCDFQPGVEPFAIYRALRAVNPSPYLYYLRMGETEVLGSSPEMLVKVTGRRLEYRPIAGTRPRGADETADLRLEEELRADEKERAEHVMLVDLGRNDLGRVAEYGSVRVRDLMFVERYSHVMHLVSALEARLRPGLDALDAFTACFPAGTLTGAPKVRSMQLIEELEPVRRGLYGGAVLYADFAGNLDSCIAIRTLLARDGRAYVQAGAGIVADSRPEREWEECWNKARGVMRAVEMARASSG
ncbi:MAG TPA: anthranilate synthase component I [Terriglobales bacterium]|nr:anthranilate synthase component I [Terriglobales bacterium]